jgi:hypothetical protein
MTKHQITTKAAIALSTMLVAVFCSCTKVKLYQEVRPARVCEGTVYVSTYVRTYNWYGFPNTLEYWEQECVKESVADSIKVLEYNKAIPTFLRAKNCY